jgi:hypothetical protein
MRCQTNWVVIVTVGFGLGAGLLLAQEVNPGGGELLDYAPLVGDYEFYIDDNYVLLSFYLENGRFYGGEPGTDESLVLTPVNPDHLTFLAEDEKARYFHKFLRDETGVVTGCILELNDSEYAGMRLAAGQNSGAQPGRTFSMQELQDDFRQLREAIESQHPALYAFTPQAEFDRLFAQQFDQIKQPLRVEEFYRIIAPVVARIGCGHSSLRTPQGYWDQAPAGLFPLELGFTGGRAFVAGHLSSRVDPPLGSEILGIGDRGMPEIATHLRENLPADGYNDSARWYRLDQSFNFLFALRYGFAPEFRVICRQGANVEPDTMVLPAVDFAAIRASWTEAEESEVTDRDPNLNFKIYPETGAGVMTIRTFSYYQEVERFTDFLTESFAALRQANIQNLILDLRDNDGGDPFCTTPLLSYLEPYPVVYFAEAYHHYEDLAQPIPMAPQKFPGKLFVLINGGCFSSTGHLCALLRYHGVGTFVGTETAGTYTCNDASRTIELRHTRFRFKSARMTFQVAVEGLPRNRGISPDYLVEPQVSDWVSGGDAIMDFTLNLIGEGDPGAAGE